MELYIPKKFSIEEFAVKHNLKEKISGFKLDKLAYPLNLLSEIPFNDKRYLYNNGFIPFKAQILQKIIGKEYKKYLDYLENEGVIFCDNQYIVNKKCFSFQLNPNIGQEIIPYKIKDTVFANSLYRAYQKHTKSSFKSYKHLNRWFNDKLEMDYDKALYFIEENYSLQANNPHIIEKKSKWNGYYHCEELVTKDIVSQYKSSIRHLEMFKSKSFRIPFVDKNVHRYHSVLTNMNSTLRNTLTYDGIPLVSLDIKNSQPFFSTLLFTESFWNDAIKNRKYKKIFEDILKHNKINPSIMISKISEILNSNDVQEYLTQVKNGLFYETFLNEYNNKFMQDKDRDFIKGEILKILFSGNGFNSGKGIEAKRLFSNIYPNVNALFSLIKNKKKELLPILLQRIESEMVLDEICEVVCMTYPRMPIWTIHDSIVTQVTYESELWEIMEDRFKKKMGILPAIKPDYWLVEKIDQEIDKLKSKI